MLGAPNTYTTNIPTMHGTVKEKAAPNRVLKMRLACCEEKEEGTSNDDDEATCGGKCQLYVLIIYVK